MLIFRQTSQTGYVGFVTTDAVWFFYLVYLLTASQRYQFALKTFEVGNKEIYDNERKAFNGLRDHNGMVRCLLDFEHREIRPGPGKDQPPRDTYNILLEFGDLDLAEYFADRLPPVLQIETEDFWIGLFDVADALEGIHNRQANTGGVVQEYYG